MTGMFQCVAGGWCGWGFPRAAGEMIGASALIVRTCAACASGAQPDLAPLQIPCGAPLCMFEAAAVPGALISILETCAEAWTAGQWQNFMAVSRPVSVWHDVTAVLCFLSAPLLPMCTAFPP